METILVTCRACEGEKRVEVCTGHDWTPKYGGGPVWEMRDCETCSGTGEVEMTRAELDDALECRDMADGRVAELEATLLAVKGQRLKDAGVIYRQGVEIARLRALLKVAGISVEPEMERKAS